MSYALIKNANARSTQTFAKNFIPNKTNRNTKPLIDNRLDSIKQMKLVNTMKNSSKVIQRVRIPSALFGRTMATQTRWRLFHATPPVRWFPEDVNNPKTRGGQSLIRHSLRHAAKLIKMLPHLAEQYKTKKGYDQGARDVVNNPKSIKVSGYTQTDTINGKKVESSRDGYFDKDTKRFTSTAAGKKDDIKTHYYKENIEDYIKTHISEKGGKLEDPT